MALKIILPIIICIVVVAGLILFINKSRLEKKHEQLAADLLKAARPTDPSRFHYDDLDGLPSCVQRYLKKAVPEGHSIIASATLTQEGKFRLGDATAPWSDLTAQQTFTVNPPGFVWDAGITIAPFVKAQVIDMYSGGKGVLRAKVLSSITVADDGGTTELNTGELMRYLAEAVWLPTAYLPGQGVRWSEVSHNKAKATIEDEGNKASLLFTFNENDVVERVHSEGRYRSVDGSYQKTSWTGFFSNYEKRDGLLIPTKGLVQWDLDDGALPYWKGTITNIEYRY